MSTLLVFLILNGTAKTKLAMLVFLYLMRDRENLSFCSELVYYCATHSKCIWEPKFSTNKKNCSQKPMPKVADPGFYAELLINIIFPECIHFNKLKYQLRFTSQSTLDFSEKLAQKYYITVIQTYITRGIHQTLRKQRPQSNLAPM